MYNTDMPTRAELPSTRQLIRSTLIAIAAAVALLITAVLPAEYAVDPTGIGRVLGLTEMGEIKQQLSAEAQADNAAGSIPMPTDPAPASVSEPLSEGVAEDTAAADLAGVQVEDERTWNDETTLTLAPGEAAEVKLVMNAGDAATYEWTVSAGHLNSDLHGDGRGGQSISYRKGRSEASDSGELTAAFDGSHGWFWRNRSNVSVDLTLNTRGAYSEVKRVL
ncbi:hypothetical protein [Hyphomonas atlantica]|uniref:Transmembrane anchor protein n=1 Tax=Hyphomonas atlantica TaxID=1280948 RepID=A0A059E0S3_9PROT|nr:hypothetical protein [Hyphomonas atlantica]KCZ60554.1 hypothetical protein HY36_06120 [Hyphomonas atlantica]